jgi:hypothetical protein
MVDVLQCDMATIMKLNDSSLNITYDFAKARLLSLMDEGKTLQKVALQFHAEELARHLTSAVGAVELATKGLVAYAYRVYGCSKQKLVMATFYEHINSKNIGIIHQLEGKSRVKFVYSSSTINTCAWDTVRGARSMFYSPGTIPEEYVDNFNVMDEHESFEATAVNGTNAAKRCNLNTCSVFAGRASGIYHSESIT